MALNKAVIHIDLHDPFCDNQTESAFYGAKEMSELARRAQIENIWITTALKHTAAQHFQDAVNDHISDARRIQIVEPLEHELVFGKSNANAFQNMHLCAHIQEHGLDEIFITGVWSQACVKKSIIGAFEQAAAFTPFPRISLVHNAIDILPSPGTEDVFKGFAGMARAKTPEMYLKSLRKNKTVRAYSKNLLRLTSTEEFAQDYGLN